MTAAIEAAKAKQRCAEDKIAAAAKAEEHKGVLKRLKQKSKEHQQEQKEVMKHLKAQAKKEKDMQMAAKKAGQSMVGAALFSIAKHGGCSNGPDIQIKHFV